MLETIELFKAGTHRAEDGKAYTFSEADVASIAASYDPAVLAAPMVLGHPKTDDPAWGWAKGLSVNDKGVLVAETEKVDPAFADGVEAGRYRNVSIKLYAPEDAANPKPGNWYLRHIGFLGAQPPAVKGLQPAFAEGAQDGGVSFAAADASVVKDLFRGLRDWLIEDKGLELADRLLPSWWLDMIEIHEPVLTPGPGFAEPRADTQAAADPAIVVSGEPADDRIAAREAEIAAREADVAAREVAFAESERNRARQADTIFIDGLVEAGRLPPAQRERVVALFARLDGDQSIAFAEADADPRAELRQLLEGLGTSIQFAEFAAADGFSGEHDPSVLASKARELVDAAAAKGLTLSYADAVQQAQAR